MDARLCIKCALGYGPKPSESPYRIVLEHGPQRLKPEDEPKGEPLDFLAPSFF